MLCVVLAPWTTVRCASAVTSFTQDEQDWLDLGDRGDVAFFVDIAEATSGGSGGFALSFETAPLPDEMLFQPVAPDVPFAVTTSPLVVKSVRSAATAPLARYVRWKLKAPGASSAWSATFRVRAASGQQSFFAPTDIGGCLLWLQSELGVTKDAATNAVSRWADQSGRGNDATQVSSANQPIWTAAQMNGHPTLSFDGAAGAGADMLATPAFPLGVYTALMVTTGQNGTTGFFWTRSSGATGVDTLYGDVYCTMYVDRGTGTQSCRDYVSGWGQALGSSGHVLAVQFDGTAAGHLLRVDGAYVSVTTHSGGYGDPGTGTNSYSFTIGARGDLGAPAKINVAELMVYDHSLSAAELARVETYLRNRYALY